MYFIENHHLLPDGHYRFSSNHSTSLALTTFMEKVDSAMDKRKVPIRVLIDLENVEHNIILLGKIQCYGILIITCIAIFV